MSTTIDKLAKQYNIDSSELGVCIAQNGFKYKAGLTSVHINDKDVPAIMAAWNAMKQQEAEDVVINEERRRLKAQMLITSGFNFDGYTITKYSGYISGDDVIQVNRGTAGIFGGGATDVGEALSAALKELRRHALDELKDAALDLGCNAVIGVDFDYMNLDPTTVNSSGGITYMPYVFCVTANGNAVVIEKDE